MGYAISLRTVEKCSQYLDRMLEHDNDEEITWVTNNPRKLAYHMYNALKAAEVLAHEKYCLLCSRWRVESDVKNGVVTVRKKDLVVGVVGNAVAEDVFDMIDFIINQDRLHLPLIFPNGARDVESVETLKHWASENKLSVRITERGILIDK